MKDRRGFALLTALWLLVIVAALASTGVEFSRAAHDVSAYRLHARRAWWAREACSALLQARAHDRRPPDVDSLNLGSRTWCRIRVVDPSARVNLNTMSAERLTMLFGSSVAQATLDWKDGDSERRPSGAEHETYALLHRPGPRNRPFQSVAELALVLGMPPALLDSIAPLLTVDGAGFLNVNAASSRALQVHGFSPAEAERLIQARSAGRAAGSLGAAASIAGVAPDSPVLDGLAFGSDTLLAEVEGGVGPGAATAFAKIVLVPSGDGYLPVSQAAW
jgi:general secretion pathway protein K